MKLSLMLAGAVFDIYAIDRSEEGEEVDCPAMTYISSLDRNGQRSMLALLQRHAGHGPIRNESRSRLLDDGIFEFKVPAGPGHRLYYFYRPPLEPSGHGVTVLTHGGPKPRDSRVPAEVERAKRLREQLRSISPW